MFCGTPCVYVQTDLANPALLGDSLLIEVHATSVNPVDNLICTGCMKGMAVSALEGAVLLQFLIEAVVLSALGGPVGVAIATGASYGALC